MSYERLMTYKKALERAKLEQYYNFAVLFLDYDRFKIVNDSLSHFVGEELLIAIARRLEASLNLNDTLSRRDGFD